MTQTRERRRRSEERFERDEIAELASLAVRFHIARGEYIIAGALQDFATLAWASEDDLADSELLHAAEEALASLELVVDARMPRAFLRDAIASLADVDHAPEGCAE